MRISRTMPLHCNAKAAHEPTRPPPPMIATFIKEEELRTSEPERRTPKQRRAPQESEVQVSGLDVRRSLELGDDFVGEFLHECLEIRVARRGIVRHRIERRDRR